VRATLTGAIMLITSLKQKAVALSSGYNMMTEKQVTGISLVLTKCGLYKT
jgi:hypothetical protein